MSSDFDKSVFALNREVQASFQEIGGGAYALIIDDFYMNPHALRDFALAAHFTPSDTMYPGEHGQIDEISDVSAMTQTALNIVNSYLLPKMKLTHLGQEIVELTKVRTDFSVISRKPEELAQAQTRPHIDPVPIFGIVYLNDPHQGGTLFFERLEPGSIFSKGSGYILGDNNDWKLISRLEGRFNRLVIYPGIIPHSAEVLTNWNQISSDRSHLRLTQRLMFG